MKIDTFIALMNSIRQGQLTDDTDPTNTLIQQYTTPYDTLTNGESTRVVKTAPSATVWGNGTTYVAYDAQGNPWNAPSCGWLWGAGGRWTDGITPNAHSWKSYRVDTWSAIGSSQYSNL